MRASSWLRINCYSDSHVISRLYSKLLGSNNSNDRRSIQKCRFLLRTRSFTVMAAGAIAVVSLNPFRYVFSRFAFTLSLTMM